MKAAAYTRYSTDHQTDNSIAATPQSENISKAQAKRMLNISKNDIDLCKEILSEYGYESSTSVKKIDYEAICKEIQNRAA